MVEIKRLTKCRVRIDFVLYYYDIPSISVSCGSDDCDGSSFLIGCCKSNRNILTIYIKWKNKYNNGAKNNGLISMCLWVSRRSQSPNCLVNNKLCNTFSFWSFTRNSIKQSLIAKHYSMISLETKGTFIHVLDKQIFRAWKTTLLHKVMFLVLYMNDELICFKTNILTKHTIKVRYFSVTVTSIGISLLMEKI